MRLKSFVLIEKENRYLLIQEASPKWHGHWFLPGGSVKPGETLEMGAKREVMEEAGCEVKLTAVFFVKYHRGFFNKKISVFYCATLVGEQVKQQPDKESLNVQWYSYEQIRNEKLLLRQNLLELLDIYRSHTHFIAPEDFHLREEDL